MNERYCSHNLTTNLFFFFFSSRYIFKSEKKVGIQELGPRFTLKLRSLQKGTFDSKFGEYEWIHKVCLSYIKSAWEQRIQLM